MGDIMTGDQHSMQSEILRLTSENEALKERVRVLEEEVRHQTTVAELWEASNDGWKAKYEALAGGKGEG